jgi:hypothetical protein
VAGASAAPVPAACAPPASTTDTEESPPVSPSDGAALPAFRKKGLVGSGLMVSTPLPSTFRSKAISAPLMGGNVFVPTSEPVGLMVTAPLPSMLTGAPGT